ncbi:hypothetical protein [Paradesertivirga mongoliensis]
MKKVFSMCLVAMFFLAACGSKSEGNATETSSSATRAINPPHGMPGHTCAVPDGAPLPDAAVQPNLQTSPVQTGVQSLPTEMNKAVSINPAHGQPGHRCDIAVGAPLN